MLLRRGRQKTIETEWNDEDDLLCNAGKRRTATATVATAIVNDDRWLSSEHVSVSFDRSETAFSSHYCYCTIQIHTFL